MSKDKDKTKRLCRLFEKKGAEGLRGLVQDPRFICRRCGRAAREEENLCKPEDL